MTNEEKVKAYDKAIEKAMELRKGLDGYNANVAIIEQIFPELKVSEDEKIRKHIYNYIDVTLDDNENAEKEKWLAWLEKQGDQKSVEWHREDEQNLNACLGYIPDGFLRRWLKDVIHAGYDKVEPKFRVGDYIKHNKANFICKIISVNSGSYYVENIETNGRIELFSVEQNFHLLDILEVKEVVLDNAVERYIEQHKSELEGGYFDIRRIARHFFQLGL